MAYSAPTSCTPSPMALTPTVPCNSLAVDIGGSLVKIVLWEREGAVQLPPWVVLDASPDKLPLLPPPPPRVPLYTGVLRFLRFPESMVPDFCRWVRENNLVDVYLPPGGPQPRAVHTTGGGSYQYSDVALRELGVRLLPQDEFRCAVHGLNFLLNKTESEIFTFDNKHPSFYSSTRWAAEKAGLFPYMLVCIGSGVSVLKVTSAESFERVSGTALGGGSFWGLCKLLTGIGQFDDLMALVETGDSKKTDLIVGDIYGGAYSSIGLSAEVTASFFGKLQRSSTNTEYSNADVAKSLLNMVIMNVAHISFLNASLHGLHTIFFSGSFLRGHPPIWDLLSNAISWWSKGKMKAMFLLHDGYLGALGALLEPIDMSSPFLLP